MLEFGTGKSLEELILLHALGRDLPSLDLTKRACVSDGIEVALEGLLTKHTFHPLAMFDKPDPLDGPYFEETLYVTPSRLPSDTQARIVESLAKAARAIGLKEGPVHGELRINDQDIWVIEVAARSIGGKCSRMLEFGTGKSLEELILLHALGRDLPSLDLTKRAAGVMMMPIPREGILERVEGQDEARHVPGIEELVLTAKSGDQLIPLPETCHAITSSV